MSVNYDEIYRAVMKVITENNMKVNERSRVKNFASLSGLASVTRDIFINAGYSADYVDSILCQAMVYSVGHLCKDWHGNAKDAKFIYNAWVANHNMPSFATPTEDTPDQHCAQTDHNDTSGIYHNNPDLTQHANQNGQGGNDPVEHSDGQGDGQGQDGQGQGQGHGHNNGKPPEDFSFPQDIYQALMSENCTDTQEDDGNGDYTGNLIPHEDEDDQSQQDNQDQQNEGENDMSNEEGQQDQSQDETQQVETTVPPEDMPITEGYKPPAVWEVCLRILRFNVEHPERAKNIMLVGPKGIGKTKMVEELSKKVFGKLPYAITSPQQPHELTGYANAMGEEVKSSFTKGYDQEGIILIDEIDRSEEGTLIKLNMALGNKYMDVPTRDLIEQNPRCTVIATANTSGTGATNDYNTAHQLDASTRDRFYFILMQWDHDVAMEIARGDQSLVAGLEDWNHACDKMEFTSGQVSYRTIIDIQDAVTYFGVSFDDAVRSALVRYAIEKSDLQSIYNNMESKNGKVAKAIKRIHDQMPDRETQW